MRKHGQRTGYHPLAPTSIHLQFGDKEQILVLCPTKTTSSSFCYQITQTPNEASLLELLLLIFTLNFPLWFPQEQLILGICSTCQILQPVTLDWLLWSPAKTFQKRCLVALSWDHRFFIEQTLSTTKKPHCLQKSCRETYAAPPQILSDTPPCYMGSLMKRKADL